MMSFAPQLKFAFTGFDLLKLAILNLDSISTLANCQGKGALEPGFII
jgi:hypothetical protein